MSPIETEHLVRQLARAIDADEPPGMAAGNLARAVVYLVKDREPREAVILEERINHIAALHPRSTNGD